VSLQLVVYGGCGLLTPLECHGNRIAPDAWNVFGITTRPSYAPPRLPIFVLASGSPHGQLAKHHLNQQPAPTEKLYPNGDASPTIEAGTTRTTAHAMPA
jgi:hypothetical protein